MAAVATPAVASPQHGDQGEAEAQQGEPVIIEIHGRAPRPDGIADLTDGATSARDRGRALSDPAFATVIRTEDRAGETVSLGEALTEAGAHTRSLGGLGAFSSVSVRGNDPGHTPVTIDGVPLSTIASVTANLGAFDLFGFSSVILERSAGGLGKTGMGGALSLETRVGPGNTGEQVYVSAGGGSFGARHLRGRWLGESAEGDLGWHMALAYAGAEGGFSYFDDNGTNLNQNDDGFTVRENNGYDQLVSVARAGLQGDDATVTGGVRVMARRQGVPGPAGISATAASLDTIRAIADARVGALSLGEASAEAATYVVVERQAYRDPLGEIGLSAQDRRYLTLAAGVSGRMAASFGLHRARIEAGARGETFTDTAVVDDGDHVRGQGARMAGFLALADEITLAGGRVLIAPVLRAEVQRTDPLGDGSSPLGEMDLSPRTEVFFSPRISARARALSWLTFKSNAGSYVRAPTVYEMFGDRGFLVGNPGLEAETGPAFDLGLVVSPETALGVFDRVLVSAAGFVSAPRNAIALVPTAGLATVPQNVGDAVIFGAEAGGSVRLFRHVTAQARYTFIDSRQDSEIPSYDGKRLPHRPRHHLYARVDAAARWQKRMWIAWIDAELLAGNFLDPANLDRAPPRKLLGAGLKIELVPGLLAAIEVKNLTGERIEMVTLDPAPRPDLSRVPRAVADVAGYPLPGRAFYATLEWRPL